MYIKKVKLENFRNYDFLEVEFNPNFNLLYGDNAQWKTNILEAIYIAALGRSFQTNKDQELIKIGKEKAKISIEYEKKDRPGKIDIEISDKKTFFINDIKQKRISEIIGKINLVLFYPDNIDIIKGTPQDRRKFLDIMISQLKPNYLHLLNRYNQTLNQRNVYLKQIKFDNKNINMLDVWDESLADLSYQIYKYRKKYIEKISENIQTIHNNITNCGKEEEIIYINYISSSNTKEDYYNNLVNNRKIDIKRGFTSVGIHRDDFDVFINEKKVNTYGSQGQARTAVLSLKLAELNIINEEIGEEPILLLDDFMSELDENRRTNLSKAIDNNQVFITCTDKFNIENKKKSYFYIESATVEKK